MGVLPWVWGEVPDQVAAGRRAGEVLRAVVVRAAPATVFRWLCQLKVAPYSYDLVDNLARRSPRALTPGVERLVQGERVARVFVLESFEQDRSMTLRTATHGSRRLFGDVAMVYRTDPHPVGTLLLVSIELRGGHPAMRLRDLLLAWGDLPMMRKQLHTLRELSEADERAT